MYLNQLGLSIFDSIEALGATNLDESKSAPFNSLTASNSQIIVCICNYLTCRDKAETTLNEHRMKRAIPTNTPNVLEGFRSENFGHYDVFTVAEVSAGNEVSDVHIITNQGHGAVGCMTPVSLLKEFEVESIAVAGLGMRPMQGFNQANITVYFADQKKVPYVKSVMNNLQENKLVTMHTD